MMLSHDDYMTLDFFHEDIATMQQAIMLPTPSLQCCTDDSHAIIQGMEELNREEIKKEPARLNPALGERRRKASLFT